MKFKRRDRLFKKGDFVVNVADDGYPVDENTIIGSLYKIKNYNSDKTFNIVGKHFCFLEEEFRLATPEEIHKYNFSNRLKDKLDEKD